MTTMTDRDWVKAAIENNKGALIDGIKTIYNCRKANVATNGGVWIANPQRGHWLDDDGIARALKAGDI
jgi:hypothetical protein